MASISKLILCLTFISPTLLLFFMSVVYDKTFSIAQILAALALFLSTFLVKG